MSALHWLGFLLCAFGLLLLEAVVIAWVIDKVGGKV
jgi:hypothetical protein